MASPSSIKEFRFLSNTSFANTFTNAASSAWNAADYTAYKIKAVGYDDSGLVQEGFPDEKLQTRFYSLDAPVAGLRVGGYKLTTYCEGAYANTDITPEGVLINACIGSVTGPSNSARSGTVGASSTVTNIKALSVGGTTRGGAVLLGTFGDGRGGGKVYSVYNVGTGWTEIRPGTPAAVTSGDAYVIADTFYPDEDIAQSYIHSYAVGHGTADHRQTISGAGSFTITGMAPGELPKTEFDIQVTDHQWVTTAGDRSSLTPGTEPRGSEPSFSRGIGMVHIADQDGATQDVFKCGDLSFNPNVTYEAIPEPSGPNGQGGWQKMPGSATAEMTVLIDEDIGLIDDFENGTAKSVIIQLGHTATKCTAIEFPKAYIDKLPESADLGNLKGLKITIHGDEAFVSGNDLASAHYKIHKF